MRAPVKTTVAKYEGKMTKLQEERIKRDAKLLNALRAVPQRSYLEIAAQFRVCVDVIERVARQNGIVRGPGGRRVANG